MKLSFLTLVTGFCTIAIAKPVLAAANSITSEAAGTCAGLLDPTVIQQSETLAVRYAYDQLTSEDNKTAQASNGSALIPGIDIGASGAESYNNEKKRMEQIGLHWSVDDSSSYFARFIPGNQTSAFLECVKSVEEDGDGGVAIAYSDMIGNRAHFILKIRGLTGISIKRQLVIDTNGIPKNTWRYIFDSGPDTVEINVDWPDPNQPLVIRAHMHQVGAGNVGPSEAKYILWPQVQFSKEHHVSQTVEIRSPGRTSSCCWGPAGTFYSDPNAQPLFIKAADDEILVKPVDEIGDSLPPTNGKNNNVRCNNVGIEYNKTSDQSYVSGRAFCTIGQADENPGYRVHFEMDGYHAVIPKPDPSITMVETEFDAGSGNPASISADLKGGKAHNHKKTAARG